MPESRHAEGGLAGWAHRVWAAVRAGVGRIRGRIERGVERRRLRGARERGVEDLGGLALEMARRDHFHPSLLEERARAVLSIEQRLRSIELPSGPAHQPRGSGEICRCGAPLPAGAVFCPRCGRAVPDMTPGASCSRCGQPLPADANFCGYCGTSVAAVELRVADDR